MNILIFSDSHGIRSYMLSVARQLRPDKIIHLGDVWGDCACLEPIAPVTAVCGNCDYSAPVPDERVLEIEGVRIFLAHGHRYGVKTDLQAFASAARAERADVALFGHTHSAYSAEHHGVQLFNPGSIAMPRSGLPSYGLLEADKGRFHCRIVYMNPNE